MKSSLANFMIKALTLAILVFPIVSFAEVKEIISEGTYNMGDGETPTVAESGAFLRAKRTALEQAGTYVESYSRVKNFQLIEDEIQVLASGIMEVETLDTKRAIVGNGIIKFWVKIKARVYTDKMEAMAKRVKEKSTIEDYKKIQEVYGKSQNDIQSLRKQLAATKSAQGKKKIKAKIAEAEQLFQANEWFDRGFHFGINNEYDKSIEAFTSAIDLAPNHDRAYCLRGLNYVYKGQYDLGIKDFNKAITINQTYGLAYVSRGLAYDGKGQYDRAIEDYNKAIATDPSIVALAYNFRGNAFIKRGQYDRAIEDCNKALAVDPNLFSAYSCRGLAYIGKGQYDRAIEDFDRVPLSPNQTDAYYAEVYSNRGIAYYSKGQPDQAIEDFNKAITINPNYALAYLNRGDAYGAKGQLDRAIVDYDKAIALNPNNANAYLNRGSAYGGKGQYVKEIEDYNKAIAINPNLAMAYYNRATVYYNQGQYSRAVEDYNKAIAINPNYIDAYYNRGNAYSKLKAYDQALADIKTAARLGDKKAQDVLKDLEKQPTNPTPVSSLITSPERNFRIFQPGDYINYKVTGFINQGGVDIPVFGTAQFKVLDETRKDLYGNMCKIFRMTMEFTVVGKDRSAKVQRSEDHYYNQDSYGSMMSHGKQNNERLAFVKTPSSGWYYDFKCPFSVHESSTQNIIYTDGSSKNGTDMILGIEQVSVPAGVFNAYKTISNTLTTNADSSKIQEMETTWLVPAIGPIRSNVESSSMKFILEMTDTSIPYGKEALPSTVSSIKETKKLADKIPDVVNNELGFIPFINSKVKGVRFFEGHPEVVPAVGKRLYQKKFSKSDTSTIFWELQLEHPAPRRSVEFQIIGVWYDPTGKEFFRNSLNAKILDNWPASYTVNGWGWKYPSLSKWQTGTYRVDLYISGIKIASGTFEIY